MNVPPPSDTGGDDARDQAPESEDPPGGLRSHVAESWHRSAAAGVRADVPEAPITLPDDELRDYRAAHPLARVFPLLDDILGQAARDTGSLMAVSDATGQLLWVCGNSSTRRSAESIGFVEGSNWDERLAGTRSLGLKGMRERVLYLDGGIEITRAPRGGTRVAARFPLKAPAA